MGYPGGGGVRADEDVRPVVLLPQRPDLHPEQVARLAQSVQHALADCRHEVLVLLSRYLGRLRLLLFRGHRLSQIVT